MCAATLNLLCNVDDELGVELFKQSVGEALIGVSLITGLGGLSKS